MNTTTSAPNDPRKLIHERMTVLPQGPIVVFLIGMRVNAWYKPWTWLPVALAMGRMMRELTSAPESGLLTTRGGGPGVMVQYWRSFEDLARYASDRQGQHYPAWAHFNRTVAKSGDVGIWHETFLVEPEQIECVYHHMPPTGLGLIWPLVPAQGHKQTAKGRLRRLNQAADERPQAAL